MIKILTFGGCLLNNPINHLHSSNKISSFYAVNGYRSTPYSLSANGVSQLYDYAIGKLSIDSLLLEYSYADGAYARYDLMKVKDVDLILIEISTPYEYQYEKLILNINRFNELVLVKLRSSGIDPMLIQKWKNSLLKEDKVNDKLYRDQILGEIIHTSLSDDELIFDIIKKIKVTYSSTIAIKEKLINMKSIFKGKKIAIILHNFKFLPSGESVSWPQNFKKDLINIAQELSLPTIDFADLVKRDGAELVMAKDMRHWSNDYYPQISKYLLEAINSLYFTKGN